MGRVLKNIFSRYGLVLSLLLVWELASYWISASGSIQNVQILLPRPSAVLKEAVFLLKDKLLLWHILASTKRVFVGWGLAALLAIPLGVSLALSQRLSWQFQPLINIIRFVPPVAWIPISILWFGITEAQQHYIIFIGTLPVMVLIIYNNAKEIPSAIKKAAACLGADRLKMFWKVILPGTLSGIFLSLRIGLSFGWFLIVASEFVSAAKGLGYLILEGRNIIKTERIFVGMITIGLVSYFFNFILAKIKYFVLPWAEEDKISGIFAGK